MYLNLAKGQVVISSDMMTEGGQAVQIASFDCEDKLVINWEALEQLLQGTNQKIVVYQYVGSIGKGNHS